MPAAPSTAVDPIHYSTPSPIRSPSSSSRRSRSGRGGRPFDSQPPTVLSENDPVIDFIRETLYAALADVLALATPLRTLMRTDPARGSFAAVSLAVLEVATTSVTRAGDVQGVLGQHIMLDECPAPLKPIMQELAVIAARGREVGEQGNYRARK